MEFACANDYLALLNSVAVFRLFNAHFANFIKALGIHSGENGRHMLNYNNSGSSCGQLLNDLKNSLGSACGSTDGDDHVINRANQSGSACFAENRSFYQRLALTNSCNGSYLYLGYQVADKHIQVLRRTYLRFFNKIHRTGIESVQRRYRSGTYYNYRKGMRRHQLFQKLDAAHFRHFNVKRNNIGMQLLYLGHRIHSVTRRCYNFKVLVGF